MDHSVGIGSALTWRRVFAGAAVVILALPLVGMVFTDDVAWGAEDFVAAAVLLLACWAGLEIASRLPASTPVRRSIGAVVVLAVVALWAHLAVGIV